MRLNDLVITAENINKFHITDDCVQVGDTIVDRQLLHCDNSISIDSTFLCINSRTGVKLLEVSTICVLGNMTQFRPVGRSQLIN
jgi:hypothetical protein